jgi:hypothetical protein
MDKRRTIVKWVFRLPEKPTAAQLKELESKAGEYAALVPAGISDIDILEPDGLKWPTHTTAVARRPVFVALVRAAMSGGKKASKKKSSKDEKTMGVSASALAIASHEGHVGDIQPGETFDLPKAAIKSLQKYLKAKKPEKRSEELLEFAGAVFAGLYEEREAQEVEVARTLEVSALFNDPTPAQAELLGKIPREELNKVIHAVNAEVRRFNYFESTLDQIGEAGKRMALTSGKGIRAVADLKKAEQKLAEVQASGASEGKIKTAKTGVKRAQEVVDEIASEGSEKAEKEATIDAENARDKRLATALMGKLAVEKAEKAHQKKTALAMAAMEGEGFLELQVKKMKERYPKKSSKELRKLLKNPKFAAEWEEDEQLRDTLTGTLKRNRKDLDELAREALVENYLTKRKAMYAAEEGSPEEKALEREVRQFETEFGLKTKPLTGAPEEEEEEEEDEEFKPEEEGDEEESDEEEGEGEGEGDEEEDEDEKSGGSNRYAPPPPPPLTRSRGRKPRGPKSYSGVGAFPGPKFFPPAAQRLFKAPPQGDLLPATRDPGPTLLSERARMAIPAHREERGQTDMASPLWPRDQPIADPLPTLSARPPFRPSVPRLRAPPVVLRAGGGVSGGARRRSVARLPLRGGVVRPRIGAGWASLRRRPLMAGCANHFINGHAEPAAQESIAPIGWLHTPLVSRNRLQRPRLAGGCGCDPLSLNDDERL